MTKDVKGIRDAFFDNGKLSAQSVNTSLTTPRSSWFKVTLSYLK